MDTTITDHKVGAFSPTDRSNEITEYINGLMIKGWHKVETYSSIETIPSLEERFNLVNERAPLLYNRILELVTSKYYEDNLRVHESNRQDDDEQTEEFLNEELYYCQRNNNNKARVVAFIETLAYTKRDQNIVTPAVVIEGVLNMLGKLSYSCHNIKCAKKNCISAKSAKKILKKWIESIEITNMSKIDASTKDETKFILHNIDNYVQLFWGKYKGNDTPFTVQVPSIARLVCAVDKEMRVSNSSNIVLFPSLSQNEDWKNKLKEIISHGRIDIPDELRDLKDVKGLVYQGLGDWYTPGNMNAKSSKRFDIENKVIKEYLIDICHLDKVEQGIIVDSEFILHFNVIAYSDPEIIKNLAVFLCTFHLRMHIIQNLFTDPVSLLLIYLPYLYECKKLQQDKVLLLAKSLVKDMIAMVEGNVQYVPKRSTSTDKKVLDDENHGEGPVIITLDVENIETSIEHYEKNYDAIFGKKPVDVIGLLNRYIPSKNAHYSADISDDLVEKDAGYEDDIEFEVDDSNDTLDTSYFNEEESPSLFHDEGWGLVIVLVQKFIQLGYRDGNCLHSYKDKQKHLINYARLMFSVQQFIDCYNELLNDETNSEFKDLMLFENENGNSKSFPIRYSHDQIINGMFNYGIKPLQDIVNKGSGVLMIESLIDMTKYLASKDRSKVCRSLVVLIYLYDHYFKSRNDIGKLILTNISKMNNQNVEDFNSLVSRMGSKNSEATFDNLKNDSLLVEINGRIKRSEREKIGLKTITSSKLKGEIVKQENLHLTQAKSQEDKGAIKEWIKKHFMKLDSLAKGGNVLPPNKFSIASSIEKGCEELNTTGGIIDKYHDYLEKDKALHEKVEQSRTAGKDIYDNNKDYHVLNSKFISTTMLQGFILFLNPNTKNLPYSKLHKDQLAKKIIKESSIEEFTKFLVDNNINSNDTATVHLDKLKQLKKERNGIKRVTNEQGDIDDEEDLIYDLDLSFMVSKTGVSAKFKEIGKKNVRTSENHDDEEEVSENPNKKRKL